VASKPEDDGKRKKEQKRIEEFLSLPGLSGQSIFGKDMDYPVRPGNDGR
jgi:hypothetical protein